MKIFGFGKESKATKEESPKGEVTLTNGESYEISTHIDCLGDSCPRPQLMTKKALGLASAMDVVEVAIDNPTSMEAIPPMCSSLNATHLETIKQDSHWNIYVRKN